MSLQGKAAFVFVLSISSLLWGVSHGGRILVVPLEGSHWVNIDILIEALHSRGHTVDVIRSSQNWYIQDGAQHYNTITVPVTEGFNHDFIIPIVKRIIDIERGERPAWNFVSLQLEMFTSMYRMHRLICQMAANIFTDRNLMNTLKENKYDLALVDPAWGAGLMLAHALKLPLAYYVRWITSGEGHFAIAPSPLSHIPVIEVRYSELIQGADLWLMRVDFVFEYPRPTMPNVVYMGGFQCKPAKPLPEHLEEFVQSSGEHGVIIMSLGTFVSQLPAEITNEIAAAFAKLPQKIIWKHEGDRPATLGNNTLLVDWMPQNDLLGHPKTKLFVAHGGTNGVQEAMYHGVPVVGLPVFFDQYDNLLRLKERGGAEILSLRTVDKDDNFLAALKRVLNDPSYRMNMQRLSGLHRDAPMKPMDSALFWIEFVMRHKGAAHLRTESYRLPWYAYHSVDVVLFLTGAVLLTILACTTMIRCLFTKICKRKVKNE
ncbi:UDP-glucuronosyltransferase 2B31 [Takifugu flavidus]|uniref:UDP-glucuronosyltransferase n=1 Tax=Takifugu flavidus TaxID=433684 RepID=A0A5C6NJ51_9TELE|nr:UDP-glucuronosyltransferase 2B31 [Takifugu flavidus]